VEGAARDCLLLWGIPHHEGVARLSRGIITVSRCSYALAGLERQSSGMRRMAHSTFKPKQCTAALALHDIPAWNHPSPTFTPTPPFPLTSYSCA
jgi:hypothetical protein